MSQPSRPQARGPASRRRRDLKIDAIHPLEDRCLLAPVVSVSPRLAAFTPSAGLPAGTNSGGVVVTLGQPDVGFPTAAPFTSVTQLTPISSFGGDIVRIRSGPGGEFGNGVYAITRGAGDNAANLTSTSLTGNTAAPTVTGAVNRPGVIYRVDPATGKSSIFFDLNTVVSQLDPGQTAASSVGASTGLVNWYDITFDPEGYFNGKPSMFVASVDRADPTKNAVYQIGPDGTFLGAFVYFSEGQSSLKFNVNPSAILVPPPEDQTFLRGLLAGGGVSSTSGQFGALFFDSNAFTPKQNISSATLPAGVTQTNLTFGPITGLTAANPDYASRVYSVFADFGTPAAGGIPANPGFIGSGVQGLNGELLIRNTAGFTSFSETPSPANNASTDSTIGDRASTLPTDFRRFEDIAFDQYGYFSQGANLSGITTVGGTGGTGGATNGGGSIAGTGAGGGSGTGVGANLGPGIAGFSIVNNVIGRPTITLPPVNAGSVFVADLGTGLSVSVAVPNTTPAATIRVPVQGPEFISVVNPTGDLSGANAQISVQNAGQGLGGRIVRITSGGIVRNFAENFHTSNNLDASGFVLSSLSITFSADGTTLYAADDDGIWQFKTVTSLAGSSSGSLVGLNDLRSLGVPYDGRDSAVAVVDTGVDALSSPFRGRVSNGTNVFSNGFGNDDTSSGFGNGTAATGTGTGAGNNGVGANPAPAITIDGHGTPVAGVVAQFVPQATIVPVNVFAPFLSSSSAQASLAGGGNGNGTTAVLISANSNTLTTNQFLYQGLNYVTTHPFVNDPVRPNKTDRVIASVLGFGSTETFIGEGDAYRRYPQIVISFKNQMKRFRSLGIAPIAAAGQFGAPFGAGIAGSGTGGGTGGGGIGGGGGATGGVGLANINQANNNSENTSVGDVNGIAFPAILNEVTSVTGSYSFPFATGPSTPPTNPPTGFIPRPLGPVLVFGNSITLGGTGGTTNGGTGAGGAGGTGGTTNAGTSNIVNLLFNADTTQYSGRILGAVNRGITTDFVAPAINVPTFRRTFAQTVTTTGTVGGATGTNLNGDATDHNTFTQGGTSMSAAEVTGAFALVSSALGYWSNINTTGVTASAYLNEKVGSHVLNFGAHGLFDVTAYNNPDGINSILQWTAVPQSDPNDGISVSTPSEAFGSPNFRNYSQLNVANAIAAIEAQIALQYLISHNELSLLDPGHTGRITAQGIQSFVDSSVKIGLPEAGAMAALLGGTARPPANADTSNPYGYDPLLTIYGEQPDQPDVQQRRFNFLDYAAHGNLIGSISTAELGVLAHNLLPVPDAFVVNDRQRSSVDGYLLNPTAQRNYHELLHVSPKYQFIPKSAFLKYRGFSPANFHVNRGVAPSAALFPVYTLYGGAANPAASNGKAVGAATTAAAKGATANPQGGAAHGATAPAASGTKGTAAPPAPVAPAAVMAQTPAPAATGTPTATPAGMSIAQTVSSILQNSASANAGSPAAATTISSTPTIAPATSSNPARPINSAASTATPVPVAAPVVATSTVQQQQATQAYKAPVQYHKTSKNFWKSIFG